MKKLQLFDQNHGLSALQKGQFCLLFKSMFILSRKACFLTRTSANTFLWVYFALNELLTKYQFFNQIHGLTPLEKYQFCRFLRQMFSLFRKGCFLYKTSKMVFLTIYFRDLRHGNTRGYKRLLWVTRGYRWLEEVTRGYLGLLGVTRGYGG